MGAGVIGGAARDRPGVRHRVYLNGSSLPCIDTIEDRGVMTGSSVGIYGENSISMGFVRFAAVGLN